MKQNLQHFNNRIARLALKASDRWAAHYWHHYPFGQIRASKCEYLKLWEQEKKSSYPEIDKYEAATGFAVEIDWLHELALHTQIVIKNSHLCYQHGRVLYSALHDYIKSKAAREPLTIFETGTARGFSSVVMARALSDAELYGKIVTFDILPHDQAMYWNCIDDHDQPKTRAELLEPWEKFVSPYILFVEGDSRINLKKIIAQRINFAFLDGAHTYHDLLFEFKIVMKKQKSGDVIIFDDYNSIEFPGVVQAVDEGCKLWGYSKQVLSSGRSRAYVIATRR